MSKKHKKQNISQGMITAAALHGDEYRIIKHDLLRVIVLNVIYLAAVLVLYYTNQKTHYLENWFSQILHF
jgi:hypothetical protein